MKKISLLAFLPGMILLPQLTFSQSSLGPIDFESDTLGSAPSTITPNDVKDPGSNIVEVVDNTSTPSNPIGVAGNRSVVLQDTDSGADARLNYLLDAPLTSGTVEFTFALEDAGNAGNPFGAIFMGSGVTSGGNVSSSTRGANILFSGNSSTTSFELVVITPTGTVTLDNVGDLGTSYDIVLNFDSNSDSWSGTINGDTITGSAGVVTSFAYDEPQPDLNSVEFVSGTIAKINSTFFVDNISVIPEPSQFAFLGGILVLSLVCVRRRRD